MKKICLAVACLLLTSTFSFAGEATAADQKWLSVVEKMVSEGQTSIATPSKERVALLKSWAQRNGFTLQTVVSDAGYQIKVSKNLAEN